MQKTSGLIGKNGYYVILCSVNKCGHLYQSLNEKKAAVLNFMSSDLYKVCMKTIQSNQFETDEITSSGLTVAKASWIEAPMVAECFMNLECQYLWEKEIVPGDAHVMICLEVVGGHIDIGGFVLGAFIIVVLGSITLAGIWPLLEHKDLMMIESGIVLLFFDGILVASLIRKIIKETSG